MDLKDNQTLKFYLGTTLMIFPVGFFMWSLFPGDLGMLAATSVILFLCGSILLFMTILDMKMAAIEIRVISGSEEKSP